MFALIAAALAVGAGNFTAAVSIGISAATAAVRWRVAAIFGVFEGGMPLAGLLLGGSARQVAGSAGGYVGGGLLVGLGGWQLWQAIRSGRDGPPHAAGTWRLLLAGFALSVDNLLVGFSIGIRPVSLAEAAVVFTAVSVAISLAGLELGKRIRAAGDFPVDYVAGFILVAIGALVAAGRI